MQMNIISTVKCDKCNNSGLIWWVNENGQFMTKDCECMEMRKTERYLRNCGIDVDEFNRRSFEAFETKTEDQKKMFQTAKAFLLDGSAKGIGYFGKSGTGKTHICTAIYQELIKTRKLQAKYFRYGREIKRLKALIFDDEVFLSQMGLWESCEVLYIDDLFKLAEGKAGDIETKDLELIFNIVDSRNVKGKITIFSSETSLKKITETDIALGGRIAEIIGPYGVKCEGRNRRFDGINRT